MYALSTDLDLEGHSYKACANMNGSLCLVRGDTYT